jgi:hypothetical protein
MNKVIEADSGFVNLEVAILTKHCPMTSDMLSTLLFFRGDISKSDFKEVKYLKISILLISILFL